MDHLNIFKNMIYIEEKTELFQIFTLEYIFHIP